MFSYTMTTILPPSKNKSSKCGNTVHDIELDKDTRLGILYATIIVGIIGSMLVLLWMACNRKLTPRFNHLSRVNSLILNLTIADMSVILLAVLPQLVWEYADREWSAGAAMCKIVKFLQSFSMMASNYILVVIAIDRHQAIRAPLKESMAVWKMAGVGWAFAVVCSLPMFGVFQLNEINGRNLCENIFRGKPMSHRQAWITYICLVVFFIPFFVLVICYTRIFMKIAQKAHENITKKTMSFGKGKVHLQSTQSTSLPRAKIKTLKLTVTILIMFIVCSLPYFVVEMIMSYGDHCIISKKLYGLLGGMAACNSAANPFIFLFFNINLAWIKELKERTFKAKVPRYMYSATSSTESRYSHNKRDSTHLTTS